MRYFVIPLLTALAAGCVHSRRQDSLFSASLLSAAPLIAVSTEAALAAPAVSTDTAPNERDISNVEEGEGSGSEVFISSAAPVPPPPVNLGGNGRLTITRRDTGERITVTYRKNGKYNQKALAEIDHIMRCSLDGSEKQMSVKLIELLDAVEDHFGKRGIILLSGYRSYKLNHITEGAAEHSLHMLGWAADIRVPGYSSTKVKNFARRLRVGGVGYYPSMGFTHLDVGKVRYWVVKRRVSRRRPARRHRAAPRRAAKRRRAPAGRRYASSALSRKSVKRGRRTRR